MLWDGRCHQTPTEQIKAPYAEYRSSHQIGNSAALEKRGTQRGAAAAQERGNPSPRNRGAQASHRVAGTSGKAVGEKGAGGTRWCRKRVRRKTHSLRRQRTAIAQKAIGHVGARARAVARRQ